MTLYPVLKPSGIVWLGDIPAHWKVEKLKYISKLIIDGTHFTPQYLDDTEGGIVFLRVTDIHDKIINLQAVKKISLEEHKEINKRCNPERGDLLLSKNGTIGLTKVVDWDYPCSLFVSLCLIKPLNKLNAYFLDFVFKSGLIDIQLDAGSKATTVTNLHLEKIREFQILLPSIQEQTAITHYLDQATQQIDEALRLKKEQLAQLDTYRKALIHETVTKGLDKNAPLSKSGVEWLGDVPRHWKVDRFKDIAALRNEKTKEKSEVNDYLELEDIEQWTGNISGFRSTLDVTSDVTIFKKGDVLFGKLRPYLAKYYLAEQDGKCTGEIIAFQPLKIQGNYLKYTISSYRFIELCSTMAYGAKMPRVDWTRQIAYFYMPIPPKSEQQAIVNFLDEKTQQIATAKANIKAQIASLETYRKSLIHECVTGKRRVL